jgi:putative MATE family efflux protein
MSTTALNAPVKPPPAVFTQGPIMRHVLVMTGAGSIGLMAIFFVDLLSLLYISHLHNPALTAAIGFASQVLFFSVSINIGFTIAISALVSRAIGSGDWRAAQRLSASGLVHVCVIMFILTGLALPFRREILSFLGARGETLDVASSYLLLTLPATVFLGLGMALAGVLRAAGDARRAMYVTLSGGIVTAMLDPIFIFALGLGVEGAAIVTVISRLVFVAVGLYGAVHVHGLVGRPARQAIVSDLPSVMEIAVPAILTNLATPVANAYAMRIFASFGEPTIAAFAIVDRVTPVAYGVLFALSGSVGPIMGQNLGALLFHRVRRVLTDCFLFAFVYVLAVWVVLWQVTPLLVAVFSASGQTAHLVTFLCTAGGALWLFLGAVFVANAAFNNLGFPLLSTAFNWGRATLGTMPFVTYGAARYGAEGGFYGMIIGASLFGTLAILVAYFVTARLAKTHRRA